MIDAYYDLEKDSRLNTSHSSDHQSNYQMLVITSDLNVSMSSYDRFIYSCTKYSYDHMIVNDPMDVQKVLENLDDHKILIICNCQFSFFIGNSLDLFFEDKNAVYSNVNNRREFASRYTDGSIYFYGKNYVLRDILKDNSDQYSDRFQKSGFIKYLSSHDTHISADHQIVNGRDNIILLNKYENYILNKVHSTYGFKLKNNQSEFSFRIRVNLLIYKSTYKQCINNLKKIDYPSSLLDIHIYTNQRINISDDYPIHRLEMFEAYLDIYNHYTDYDYVWMILSDYVIDDFSLLKNCINAERNIVSGLQRSKKTILSNFWGDLTETGWYKRSDDYLDIIGMNMINLWNVPYVTGNILIHTNILTMYDIFKVKNYDKREIDMILCENLRLIGEGMYLLNDRMYGYICDNEEFEGLPDWSEESILHKDFYDFIHLNRTDIFNEVGPDIWNIPFFSPEFCKHLINISEEKGNWSKGIYGEGEIDKRINTVENIPTQDIHLKDLQLHAFWQHVVKNYFSKILSHLYKYLVKNYNIAFIVKYDYENGQRSLRPHHDSSVYTINIALNSSDEYTGGGVNFISRNCSFLNKIPGYLLLHPGRITHYHEALPITSGKRYVLVSFNN